MAWVEERVNKSGTTWRAVWFDTHIGKRQREYFATQADAEEFKELVETAGQHWPQGWTPGVGFSDENSAALTFGSFALRSIESRTEANPRTRADYKRDVRLHMADLVNIPLAEINVDNTADWINSLREKNLSEKTIRNIGGLASSIMEDALSRHPPLASHNPFAGKLSRLPSAKVEEMVFLTPQEFALIAQHIPVPMYRDLAIVLAGTGLRFGEATALRVRDVDLLGQKTLTVVQAWKRSDSGSYYLGEPKTRRSRRTIAIADELVDVFAGHVAGKRGDDLVFTNSAGRQILHSRFYENAWRHAVERARVCATHYFDQERQRPPGRLKSWRVEPCGCPGVLDKEPRIHDLRHSHVSWLIAAGLPLPAIQLRLGHVSITTTIDRYGHLMPHIDVQIAASSGEAIRPSLQISPLPGD